MHAGTPLQNHVRPISNSRQNRQNLDLTLPSGGFAGFAGGLKYVHPALGAEFMSACNYPIPKSGRVCGFTHRQNRQNLDRTRPKSFERGVSPVLPVVCLVHISF
jgi:hypothetical protein